jgi:branched-chain amino acid transport system substrate-binding protein
MRSKITPPPATTRLSRSLCALALASAFGFAGGALAEPVKVGLALDISGPFAALGAEARDGFALGIKQLGGKLGGQPVA